MFGYPYTLVMPISTVTPPMAVQRTFSVLEFLALDSSRSATLSELAQGIDAPKSSLVSLLAGMCNAGYVSKDARGLYRLGARMFSLGLRILSSLDLATIARPVLERLTEETGESALLGAIGPAGDQAIYIDKVESQSPLRYTISLGAQRELYCSAAGKLLLAHLSKRKQAAYLDSHELTAFTTSTITSRVELCRELEQIRRQGYALTAGERVAGADAIAAPVWHGSDVLAAVVLAGPSVRMRASQSMLIERVAAAAKRLSDRLSATGR